MRFASPDGARRYVLTIDPGFAQLGVGVLALARPGELHEVVQAFVFETEKSNKKRGVKAADDDMRRAREIAAYLIRAVERWRPVAVTAESKSPVRNASAAAKVAMMIGALACVLERDRIPYVQASPAEVRSALGVGKSATKDDVQRATEVRFAPASEAFEAIPPKLRVHAWDAFAAFLACEDTDVVRAVRR